MGKVIEDEKTVLPRPLEPVITAGRGMRILGFVPPGGLKTTPLHALPEPKDSAAGGRGRGRGKGAGRGCGGGEEDGVRGPANWKKGRPVYQFGNYGSYYDFRTDGGEGESSLEDSRLKDVCSKMGQDFFKEKEVLDIGCNTGKVALALTTTFSTKRVVGQDLDGGLVETARKLSEQTLKEERGLGEVEFRAEDILESALRRPPTMKPERFDVVLCLSVTKWVHFTHGDDGMRRLFKRIFKRVRPGGHFVLEPQDWASYKKKRYLTPEIFKTVSEIEMKPGLFKKVLEEEIGFEYLDTIQPSGSGPKGFKRPILVFKRPEAAENEEGAEASEAVPDAAAKKRRSTAAAEEAVEAEEKREEAPAKKKKKSAAATEQAQEEEQAPPKKKKKAAQEG